MARTIHPDLLDCLRRANPYVEHRVEVTEPDAVRVIRRTDEFLGTPPLVAAMVPANSLSTDARGSLILSPGVAALAGFAGEASFYDLTGEDPQRRVKGAVWQMDPAFTRATLKSVTARVQRAGLFLLNLDFELQVFRVTKTPGVKEKFIASTQQVQQTAFTDYSFTPLLNPAPVIKASTIAWDGAQKSTLNFDLSNYALILENTPSRAERPDQVGELPKYYFVVRVLNNPVGSGHYRWLVDNASARTLAGIGTFQRVFWARDNDQQQWVENLFADVPTFAINIETYPASGQAKWYINLPKVPDVARGTVGRVVFERFVPPATTAAIELSIDGINWTPAKHGDVITTVQQNYQARVTLTSAAPSRATPTVAAVGIEFRIPVDVSVEGIPQLPTREVGLPWPKASIPEGKLTIVRTGVRDYLDTAGIIGSTQPTTKLECDIYLASRHPALTRDKWLHMERLSVTNRIPGATSETLTLLSYAAKLKKKLPQKVESLNTVHTVTAATVNDVTVTPNLVGTTVAGNEYDGKGYYMRVRSTSNANVDVGFVQTIQGNTNVNRLDFVPALPVALSIGDVVEVHSGIFATQPISWTDADPADVWYELLTTWAGIPPERIGIGSLPRGGKPPRVTDIAPGDAATQAKLKITNKLSEIESADELLDQVSAIVGGVTMEMPGGQICFVQIFPLRNATGTVTVPLPPVVKTFDARDYGASLQTPPGLEKRATVMSATYGVPLTAAAPDTYPKQTTVTVDNDALLWLTQQDLEDFGSAEVPDKIARWLYNTSDGGLYLASSLTATYVRALSTGLRVFPFGSVEKNPELMPGDSVVVITDQYTDYEPSTGTPLRGMLSVRGVLVGVGNEGRQLTMFVPGLQDNIQRAQGGGAGSLPGLQPPPDAPILSGSFDGAGQLYITSFGSPNTAYQKIAVGTGEPTDAFTRAGAQIPGQNQAGLASGLTVLAGATAWIKAFAYAADGTESAVAKIRLTREGSGTADPPVPFIVPLDTEVDDTIWYLGFNAIAGSGGGGANLTYTIYQKIGFAAETVLSSGNATAFPLTLGIARHPRSDKAIRFAVTDTITGQSAVERITVPSARPEITNTGLQLTSGVTESGGAGVNRLLAKPLAGDPNSADGLADGVSFHRISASFVDGSNRPVTLQRTTGGDSISADTLGGGIGTDVENYIANGGGQDGLLNAQAPNWTDSSANGSILAVANDAYVFGGRSLRIVNSTVKNTYHRQQVAVNAGDTWELSGVILTSGLVGVGSGAFFNVDVAAGGFVIIDKMAPTDPAPSEPDLGVGVAVGGGSSGFHFVRVVFKVTATTTMSVYCQLGYTTCSGSAWFDGIKLRLVSRVVNEGGQRGYGGFTNTGGGLVSIATESGGTAVNRLLAKPLAADPNNFDSLADGTTYRRVVGVSGGQVGSSGIGTAAVGPVQALPRFRCKIYNSADWATVNSTNKILDFNSEAFDVGTLHDNVTNNTRITIPSGGNTGVWMFVLYVRWAANAVGARNARIRKNGVDWSPESVVQAVPGGNDTTHVITVYDDAPAVGDYYEAVILQISGGALNAIGSGLAGSSLSACHMW